MTNRQTYTNDLLCAGKKETILWHKANPIWVDCSHFVAGINKLATMLKK